ncbi:hypothetical protein S7711_05914 [Stachybotrys chartarum IBT 7711]|uniref:FAD-binding domain-containing protein n=1 Tax=Stachybotrys chartarum (strain CBS 109288 / IBT 7711) TaxID=1280523 RepID=A0A084B194_STACB|nr:hypothetical protein S7711_05914 [Stachybotrys chartarum IBT 7711]KFA51561.1 hypothetical protein S40293_03917 [Stachybotrys chartarum IBT 40293]
MGALGFKVIVIGSGPAGLVAAHALHLAGLDFVVLERRPQVAELVGASLVIDPPSMRVLSQFGLLDKLTEHSCEVTRSQSLTKDGYMFKDTDQIKVVKKCHGSGPLIFHRPDLLKVLYEGLPADAKEKVLPNKQVVFIDEAQHSVTVTCVDGSTYTGSMVIGADGVHSMVRRHMRRAALRRNPGAEWDDEFPFEAQYRALWCTMPRQATIPPGEVAETQHQGRSAMFLAGKERSWMFLYEKLPRPTKERVKYNAEEKQAYADTFADWPIWGTVKVKDIFEPSTAGMANLEEGILKHFSHGRIVLVGDACHKFTPNAGLGLNNGIQDVAALCNNINAAVAEAEYGRPNVEALGKAFHKYQEQRGMAVSEDFNHSAMTTRLHAWANTWYYLFGRFFLRPVTEWFIIRFVASQRIRKALVLDYVRGEEPYVGTHAWIHPIKPLKG